MPDFFEVCDLTYKIHHKHLLDSVTLSFSQGLVYGILGPNGSGKSTLLKCLAHVWKPTSGSVFYHQKNLNALSRLEISQSITLVPHNPSIQFDFSVQDFVAMGCYAKKSVVDLRKIFQKTNLTHLKMHKITRISQGEKQRAYLARALASQAPILLLDEPFNSLDLSHQFLLTEIIADLKREGKTIIITHHGLTSLKALCDQIILLDHGQSMGVGTYEEIVTPANLQKLFNINNLNINKVFLT